MGPPAMMLKRSHRPIDVHNVSRSGISAASVIATVAYAAFRLNPARARQAPVRKCVTGSMQSSIPRALYNLLMASAPSPEKQINKLREEIRHHEHLYYVLDTPELTDAQYDALVNQLKALEAEHPELITPDSPTQRVGGKPKEGFVKTPHSRPMLSLDNAYNEDELRAWDQRVRDALPSTETTPLRLRAQTRRPLPRSALRARPARLRPTAARPHPRRRHHRRRCHQQRPHHPLRSAQHLRNEAQGRRPAPDLRSPRRSRPARKPRLSK